MKPETWCEATAEKQPQCLHEDRVEANQKQITTPIIPISERTNLPSSWHQFGPLRWLSNDREVHVADETIFHLSKPPRIHRQCRYTH